MSGAETTIRSGGGLGLTGALTCLFVALKLTGHIDWSWWWVLSPLWIGALIAVAVLVVLFIVLLVVER